MDKWNDNSQNCDHLTHSEFKFNFSVLIIIIAIVVAGLFGLYYETGEWDKAPTEQHEVVAVVLDDGDSECVFVIDGKRIQTHKSPCVYSVGDVIEMKVRETSVSIIGAIYDD